MNGDLIKAGVKGLVALAILVAGGTVGKKGYEDFNRYKQNNPNNSNGNKA